jgi:G3E family GTPase
VLHACVGKTTLLNHLLTENHKLKLCVIENEFGAVGVDDELIKKRKGATKLSSEDQVIEMMHGCICCTVRGDLITILHKLLVKEKRKFDGILIETTGLADPAPVAQTFFVDDTISKLTTLDAIITVIDAKHIIMRLDEASRKELRMRQQNKLHSRTSCC